MNDFIFQSPTKFVFGLGVADMVGNELAAIGQRKALIVYGGASAVRS
jgi:alcohol dehydrogenase YqhD (iron-dependent ADH family)